MSKVLEIAAANMVALKLQAKCFHLNVTGPRFYGDHKTYDGIAEMADEWFDTLAERLRALSVKVPSSLEWAQDASMLSDSADEDSDADSMAECMVESLENFIDYLRENYEAKGLDVASSNMLQEVETDLGKQLYFVRSSL